MKKFLKWAVFAIGGMFAIMVFSDMEPVMGALVLLGCGLAYNAHCQNEKMERQHQETLEQLERIEQRIIGDFPDSQ